MCTSNHLLMQSMAKENHSMFPENENIASVTKIGIASGRITFL